MGFTIGNPNAAKEAQIAKAKAAAEAAKQKELGAGGGQQIIKYVPPSECTDRIRVVFDDSGSMSGQIQNAKDGVVEFFRSCVPNQTACAIHFLETTNENLSTMCSNLPAMGVDLQEARLTMGMTPLFETMHKVIQMPLTRMIAFTDGSPTDSLPEIPHGDWYKNADVIIKIAVEKKVPIDTVFFGRGTEDSPEIKLLKYFSDKTGGYFLHFDPAKVSFRQAFKYLAPVNRLMLASESVRKEIESGKRS